MTTEQTPPASYTPSSPEAVSWPRYAGFWRRLIAFLIDYVVVFIPIFILVAILFSATNGGLTGSFTLRWNACYEATMNESSHPSLSDYDWKLCKTSIFGLSVAQWAQGHPKAGIVPGDASPIGTLPLVALALDSQGNIRPPSLDVGSVEWIALFGYLLLMEMKSGASIGKRILGIEVRDNDDFRRVGLPARKAVRRQAMKFLGILPMILLAIWSAFQNWRGAFENMPEASSTALVVGLAVTLVAAAWPIWIATAIIISRIPVHDRFAETSVRVFPDRD